MVIDEFSNPQVGVISGEDEGGEKNGDCDNGRVKVLGGGMRESRKIQEATEIQTEMEKEKMGEVGGPQKM